MLHVGVYGLIEDQGRLLVVRKTRGPYIGLYDLPGGRPQHGEPLEEALCREIQEETGVVAKQLSWLANLAFVVPYGDNELYHIALVYKVNRADFTEFNASIREEDVGGSVWLLKKRSQRKTARLHSLNRSTHARVLNAE